MRGDQERKAPLIPRIQRGANNASEVSRVMTRGALAVSGRVYQRCSSTQRANYDFSHRRAGRRETAKYDLR